MEVTAGFCLRSIPLCTQLAELRVLWMLWAGRRGRERFEALPRGPSPLTLLVLKER